MKTIFITYCSKEKDESNTLLKAVKRYKSNRIQRVYEAAKLLTADFMILSGEFGLLNPGTEIPYYDHLLVMEEVNKYTEKLTKQLTEIINKNKENIKIILFTEYLKNDPNLKPYQISLKKACENLNIEFTMIETETEINNLL